MKKKKIYIVGKVTGLPWGEVETKFHDAAQRLRELGFIALNPIEIVNNPDASWNDAMRTCIAEIMLHADALFVLPDWRNNSKGAKLEVDICLSLGIPMFGLEDWLLRHFGMFPQEICDHPNMRQKANVVSAVGGCETIQAICMDCSAILSEEINC